MTTYSTCHNKFGMKTVFSGKILDMKQMSNYQVLYLSHFIAHLLLIFPMQGDIKPMLVYVTSYNVTISSLHDFMWREYNSITFQGYEFSV